MFGSVTIINFTPGTQHTIMITMYVLYVFTIYKPRRDRESYFVSIPVSV